MERDFSADMNEAMPSIATLERYVKGELSGSEAEQLETQIAEDPMLADVVEGLRMTRADSGHLERMSRLHHRVSAAVAAMPPVETIATRRKSRVKPFPQYLVYTAVAAGIALLLVFVGLMKNQEESPSSPLTDQVTSAEPAPAPTFTPAPSESMNADGPEEETPLSQIESPVIADATPAPRRATVPPPPPPPLNESAPEEAPEEEVLADEAIPVEVELYPSDSYDDFVSAPSTTAPTGINTVPATTDSSLSVVLSEEPVVAAAPAYGNSTSRDDELDLERIRQQAQREESEVVRQRTSELEAVEEQYSQTQSTTIPDVEFFRADIPAQSEDDRIEGSLMKAQVMADLLQLAKGSYERNQPDSAIGYLDEVLLSEPGNVTASYYKGIALMAKNEYKDAMPLLETAASIDESSLQIEAEYQLARATLLAGKNRKARTLLTEIVEKEGKYAEEAAALLENMD